MQRIGKIGSLLWAHRLVSGGVAALVLIAIVSSLLLFGLGGSPAGMLRQQQAGARGSVRYQLTPGSTTTSSDKGSGNTSSTRPTSGGSAPNGTPTGSSNSGSSNGGQTGTSGTPGSIQSGSGATPTPTAGQLGSGGAGNTPTPKPNATPTSTSSPSDAATVVSQSSPLTIDANTYFTVFFRVENRGTSTWVQGFYDYTLVCTNSCPSAQVDTSTISDIAPGQQLQFTITLWESDNGGTQTTYHPAWTLVHNRVPFGPALTVPVTIHGFAPILQQAVPSCSNPSGVSWEWWNTGSGNSISCDGSSLTVQQGKAASYPTAVITSINGAYDDNEIRLFVHVHFGSISGTAMAALLIQFPSSAGQCGSEVGVGVSPKGCTQRVHSRQRQAVISRAEVG